MKKGIIALAAAAVVAFAGTAAAVVVTDPTPTGTFSGSYTKTDGTTGVQQGYIYVADDPSGSGDVVEG